MFVCIPWGRYSTKFLDGDALPRGPTPIILLYTTLNEKIPLSCTFYRERYPFHVRRLLEHCITFIGMKSMNNTVRKHQALPEEMLSKKLVSLILFLFTFYLNQDRFPYPFTHTFYIPMHYILYVEPEKRHLPCSSNPLETQCYVTCSWVVCLRSQVGSLLYPGATYQ